MKLKTLILISILLGVLLAVMSSFIVGYYGYPIEFDTLEFDMNVTNERIGLNTGRDKLHFGKICQGCTGRRPINYTNNHEFPITTKTTSYVSVGSPDVVIGFEGDYEVLPAQQTILLDIWAVPMDDSQLEWKEGVVVIEVYRAHPFKKLLR
jgi:hypothetical protein